MPKPFVEADASALDRSSLVGASVAGTEEAGLGAAHATLASNWESLAPDVHIRLPKTDFVYEALVELGQGFLKIGMGPLGERTIVPITGGKFAGPKINGVVLNGGADRQLVRADGALLLNAVYELKVDDGAILSVSNRALVTKRADGSAYSFSQLEIIAPVGPHDWLNHLVFVGDLHFDPARPKVVLIRVYCLT